MKFGLVILLLLILLPNVSEPTMPGSHTTCKKNELFKAQNTIACPLHLESGAFSTNRVWLPTVPFEPITLPIDSDLIHWATQDTGETGGHWSQIMERRTDALVVQRKSDPAAGYYVSTTALYAPDNLNARDPHRYVDSARVPYVALHPKTLSHARLGDFATVVNFQNGKTSAAIVADESAADLPVGEGSMALAEALGIDSSPRHGGKDDAVAYLIYPGSGNGRPRPLKEIVANSKQLFEAWGGFDRLNTCLADD